ncbi:HNH endonuclease [Clostridium sp. 2-1]|uniref:HNH endonuclease domain-containing protein n=1 Tax=Clostridium TaxID=1485 RepID=UPI000CDAFB5A|nr:MULTISPECIES: HNH endonuclease domain-containing protein [Clostridium]MBN7575664.1 HNH endonuclease [Clostridium beijerinckii]MBN7580567.1 HNH endonuclease [Clostridium beijerinckii]MBN7585441.1 HNH endonuclease [Clostridium beijerinckii]MBO0520698.1 HNH endonuclease [Clostridium beijerinckii]POO89905.1 HNH endonuclease [Clostridium sp. 2-1]
MNDIYTRKDIILPKEICEVPYSNEVDYATFSRSLRDDKVVASYKMYWLLALLDEISLDNFEIEFRTLICKMVVKAWYPLLKYKLSFGLCDNLAKVATYISDTYNLESNYDERKLFHFIYSSQDKTLNKMLKELTLNVPYRFLSPFFENKLRGQKKVQKLIEELSKEDNGCIYEIYKNYKDENCIRIKDNWCNYLKFNYRIIQGWAYYKLVCFLQKRNPNVPGIAMKLEAPKNRDLREQTKIWKKVIEQRHITDLYTGLDFTETNYNNYGVLSIDHFIPWSFVLHDQMWNLVPTFKNINSKKSDNLLQYDTYIDRFCEMQYEAFCFVVDENRKNQLEEYGQVLKVDNLRKFKKENKEEEFVRRMKQEIGPVYGVAVNQGFGVLGKFI